MLQGTKSPAYSIDSNPSSDIDLPVGFEDDGHCSLVVHVKECLALHLVNHSGGDI